MKTRLLYRSLIPPDEGHEEWIENFVFYNPEEYAAKLPTIGIKAKPEPVEPKPAPASFESRQPLPDLLVCSHCGAMAFEQVKRCRSCKRLFNPVETKKAQPILKPKTKQARKKSAEKSTAKPQPAANKLTVEEFEQCKAELNKARKKWMVENYAADFKKPYPPHILELEKKIDANIDLARNFQLGIGYENI